MEFKLRELARKNQLELEKGNRKREFEQENKRREFEEREMQFQSEMKKLELAAQNNDDNNNNSSMGNLSKIVKENCRPEQNGVY